MVQRVTFILYRNTRDFFNGNAVCFHVPILLQSEDPEQVWLQRLFGDGIEDREKRRLWMRLAGRHLFFTHNQRRIVEAGSDVKPSLGRCVDSRAAADITAQKWFVPRA